MTSSISRLTAWIFFAGLVTAMVFGEQDVPDRFAREQELVLPEGTYEYLSIELEREHYREARPGLEDIRVRDSRGVYMPYIINSSRSEQTSEQRTHETAPIGILAAKIEERPVVHYDFQVVDFENRGEVNTIAIETGANDFSCQVRVSARTAKDDWIPVATDTVYRLSDVVKLTLESPEVPLYQFWRVTVDEPSPFESLSITPRLDRQRSESRGFVKDQYLTHDAKDYKRDGRTVLEVQNPDRLRLVSITLETGDLFKRTTELHSGRTRLATKQLYRIPSGGDLAADTTIGPAYGELRDESFSIIIENRDNLPLGIEGIRAQYRVDYIVFKPGGFPPYYLVYGNESLEKPVYDLVSYKDEILSLDIGQVTLKEAVVRERPETDKEMGKTAFTLIVILSAAVLFVVSLVTFFRRPSC